MMQNQPYRFIISGGGTGGHIFPAIAVANEIRKSMPGANILFVGAKGKMEMTKVPQAGYEIMGLWIGGLQRRFTLNNLLLPIKIFSSLVQAWKLLKRFKPNLVIGFGGYASVPVLYMANRMKIPTAIQEQNAFAGIANKLLGKKARKIFVAFEGMERYFPADKIRITGNPVHQDLKLVSGRKSDGCQKFQLSPDKQTLLVLGGSLGARTINESMLNNLADLVDSGIQVIWQTGKLYYQEMESRAAAIKTDQIKIHEFLDQMDLAYAVADVVISRAGAISIAELSLVQKPVIFVPSPNVAEDHQTKNAKYLSDRDAALLVPDQEAVDKLVSEALRLIEDTERQETLINNIGSLSKPDATKEIVEELMEIVK